MKPLDHIECDPSECIHAAKRRARLDRPEVQGYAEMRETTFGENEVRPNAVGRELRRKRLQELDMAMLAQREEMVRHGDPMPLQDLRNVLGDALRLADAKNAQYADAWRKSGYMGNLARLKSKMDRLDAMLWHDSDGNSYALSANYTRDGETILDTLLDLINLAGFMAINWTEENRWGRS